MKANELMIGDWAKFRVGKYPYKRGEVVKLDRGEEFVLSDKLEPIPLTEEILKANGFELYLFEHYVLRYDNNHELFSFKITKGGVFSDEGYRMRCGLYNIEIQYVHELQHALRMCGLNELADNFKIE